MSKFYRVTRIILMPAFALLVAEATLWWLSFPAWWAENALVRPPEYVTSDKDYGWRAKPGIYHFRMAGKELQTITFESDGSRSAGSSPESAKRMILLGDSYLMGHGLSDEETIAWILQRRLPDQQIKNFGLGGYGTCHALHRLETLDTRAEKSNTSRVIYLFNSFHAERNLGSPLSVSAASLPGQEPLLTCKAQVEPDGEVRIQPIQISSRLGISSKLRSVALIEEIYRTLLYSFKKDEARKATEGLLKKLFEDTRSKSIKLMVALVDMRSDFGEYLNFLEQEQIPFIDCSKIILDFPDERLPDGHPNAKLNERLANCIADGIEKGA